MKRGRPVTLSDNDLLTAAQSVFLEKGLDATTSEIAQHAEISESVIFYRYKTKESLFLAVFERHLKLDQEIENLNTYVGKGDLTENLLGIAMLLIDKMRTVLPLIMIAFSSPIKMTILRKRLRQVHPVYVQPLIKYFTAEARTGRLKNVDSRILANTFYGAIREYVFMELFTDKKKHLPLEDIKYMKSMIGIFLEGTLKNYK